MPIFIFTKERRKKLIKLKDTYGNIDDTTLSKIIKERAKAANPYQTKPSQEF